jgi:hypothetical protein
MPEDKQDDLAELRRRAESVEPELRDCTTGFLVSTVLRIIKRAQEAEAIIEEWRRAGLLPENATPEATAEHIRALAKHWRQQEDRLEMVLQDAEAGNYQPPWLEAERRMDQALGDLINSEDMVQHHRDTLRSVRNSLLWPDVSPDERCEMACGMLKREPWLFEKENDDA